MAPISRFFILRSAFLFASDHSLVEVYDMPLRIGWLLVICCSAAIEQVSLSAAEPADPEDIAVLKDIAYRDGPSRAWRLDLAMKKERGAKPRPGIVVVHGGG